MGGFIIWFDLVKMVGLGRLWSGLEVYGLGLFVIFGLAYHRSSKVPPNSENLRTALTLLQLGRRKLVVMSIGTLFFWL